jgi:large subunit ribosomal protein L35
MGPLGWFLGTVNRTCRLKGEKMPKQKTHKGTKKRFRISGRGKVLHRCSGTGHLAARMSQKRKRKLRGTTTLSKIDSKRIREALSDHSY